MSELPYSKKRYRKRYNKLLKTGFTLLRKISLILDPDYPDLQGPGELFIKFYQRWYADSLSFLRDVYPARADEFELLYQGNPKRRFSSDRTYSFREWLLDKQKHSGRFTSHYLVNRAEIAINLFRLQCEILKSADIAIRTAVPKTGEKDR